MLVSDEMERKIAMYIYLNGKGLDQPSDWAVYDALFDEIWDKFYDPISNLYSGNLYDFCCALSLGVPSRKFLIQVPIAVLEAS
jgi:hypothetical protein